jgi:hypothetical protein
MAYLNQNNLVGNKKIVSRDVPKGESTNEEGKGFAMKLSRLLWREMKRREIRTIKDSAHFLGMSIELIRIILNKDYVPRDNSLIKIAKKLGIDATLLLLAAHEQRMPPNLRSFMLRPAAAATKNKRIWPLSLEQCTYLEKIMSPAEIQLVRKYRQLSPEENAQVLGYINYMFSTQRVAPPSDQQQSTSPAHTTEEYDARADEKTRVPPPVSDNDDQPSHRIGLARHALHPPGR